MKLTLGFSTCPNDTFIFDAMVHGKIDTEGLDFDLILADVEALNRLAFRHSIQISKLSFHAFAYVAGHYQLLDAGSAMGRKNGPLLIARSMDALMNPAQVRVAIPGRYTTANFLFSLFFPQILHKYESLFSEIEDEILRGKADAGVIIHENRFTYEKRGLLKLADLGEMWELKTGLPIPLGCIAIDRTLPAEVIQKVDRVLRRSVCFALDHPESSVSYVKEHAREMETAVVQQHISLYVNDFSVSMGDVGKKAVHTFFNEGFNAGIIPFLPSDYLPENQKYQV